MSHLAGKISFSILIPLMLLTSTTVGWAAEFHVSPSGDDTHAGTAARPFATLERARQAVRDRRKQGNEPVTVFLGGGVYERRQPLAFGPEDSGTPQAPVVWRNLGAERVVLSGGRRIQGFQPVTDPAVLKRLPETARGKVLQADLAPSGMRDFGTVAEAGKRLELFFAGQPMPLTRWPNTDFTRVGDLTGGKPITSHGLKGDAIGKFTYAGDRPSNWAGETDAWVSGYWFWDWSDGQQRIASITPETRTIELAPPQHNYGFRKGQRYYAFNLLPELDTPGEWYLDRQRGTLYFWPPGDPDAGVILSEASAVLTFDNASWITVRGLVIEATRGTAVRINAGTGVRMGGCVFRNTGAWAVSISGGKSHGVTGCDIYQTGEGGVALTGGDRATLEPAGHFVDNNHIHHYARLIRTYRPAIGLHGVGNGATHNLIHDAPHNGILLSGNDHLVEFNDIHRVCQETGDVGAFYMGRDWTMRGNLLRHNFFHHISGPGLHGAMAVYLDDAASGTTIFGNIFFQAARAAFIGGGRDNVVENNVFVDCQPAVHVDARGLGWMRETAAPGGFMDQRLDAVPFQKPPWSVRYPELVNIRKENPPAPRGNVVRRNINSGGRWLNLEKAAEPGVTFEANLTDKDPRFADAQRLNFQLLPDSPAWKLGFQRIPVERIGLQQDEWRKALPAESLRP